MTIAETLKLHQEATDTSDKEMLDLVTQFLEEEFGGPYPTEVLSRLVDFVQENLERAPGDRPTPLWRSELFTVDEQNRMVEMMIEEVRDSAKAHAHDMLNGEELIELIGYVDNDPEDTCRVLLHWGNAVELEELKANMGAAGVDIEDHVKYALRFALLDERGVTERGREYMNRWL